jgi:hypothetical protein
VVSKALANSVTGQFIHYIREGYSALAPEWQAEIKTFIRNSQHPEGGFINRAGKPDFYYSLFGVWISKALGLEDVLENHRKFIIASEGRHKDTVDTFAYLLIMMLLFGQNSGKPSLVKLLRLAFFESRQTSFHYRLFLFMLVLDARYRNPLIWYPARPVLWFYRLPADSPCSIHAALLFLKKRVKLKSQHETGQLLSFYKEGLGFKAFPELEEGDLLSTAVALFALKTAGSDLRLLAPGCFDFIEKCYSDGAFLAGNGDNYRDLEYTFYGLLALGTLV